jgi:hypothetical protein
MSLNTPSQSNPSVLQVLQQPNPELTDRWAGAISNKNRHSDVGNHDEINLDNNNPSIQPWRDFTFKAISLAYRDILNMRIKALLPSYSLVGTLYRSLTTIHGLDDIEKLGGSWVGDIVWVPIKRAATELRPRLSASNENTNPLLLLRDIWWTDPLSLSTSLKPDWVSGAANQRCSQ